LETHEKDAAMTLPQSDHYNGKTFFNPGDTSDRGLIDLLRWKLTSRPKPWPERVVVVRRPMPPAPAPVGVVATWVGQSTFLLRSSSCTILTDPVFSERAGPVSWAGPRRAAPPGLDFDSVPGVDLVLLSHDHYDHCDLPTLRRLARRDDPLVISPLGHRSLLEGAGLSRIIELDWWQTHVCGPGVEATLVPARHWSRRRPFGTNSRLWGGFMLKAGGRLVYFAGDSGYQEGLFAAIAGRCGAPDLALIPIGAYEPRWFMAPAHMNPAEAVRVHREVRSRRSIAMHWGTFQLTDEGRDEPVLALGEARSLQGVDPGAFAAIGLGESAEV
jgi:L-ascorbate metabolism protein UlaG (beta-lactamase superfamily)